MASASGSAKINAANAEASTTLTAVRFRDIDWPIPNFVKSNLPGFERMATALMKRTFREKGVASIEELRELSVEAGVKLFACQMTVDAFGFAKSDFIPEIAGWVGAATFLPMAQKSDITLFI